MVLGFYLLAGKTLLLNSSSVGNNLQNRCQKGPGGLPPSLPSIGDSARCSISCIPGEVNVKTLVHIASHSCRVCAKPFVQPEDLV